MFTVSESFPHSVKPELLNNTIYLSHPYVLGETSTEI